MWTGSGEVYKSAVNRVAEGHERSGREEGRGLSSPLGWSSGRGDAQSVGKNKFSFEIVCFGAF